MTLNDLIPGRREKQPKKHRADDRIAALTADYERQLAGLRDENVRLHHFKAAADDHFMVMDQLVTDLGADVRRLTAQVTAEQGARAVAEADAAARDRWVRDLENQLADAERRLDIRRFAESVVTQTQPIPVITERFDSGPVVRLGASPQAVTDPGRVPPTWARTEGVA
jgi:hypothetical protein